MNDATQNTDTLVASRYGEQHPAGTNPYLKYAERSTWVEFETYERPDGTRYTMERDGYRWGATLSFGPWETSEVRLERALEQRRQEDAEVAKFQAKKAAAEAAARRRYTDALEAARAEAGASGAIIYKSPLESYLIIVEAPSARGARGIVNDVMAITVKCLEAQGLKVFAPSKAWPGKDGMVRAKVSAFVP